MRMIDEDEVGLKEKPLLGTADSGMCPNDSIVLYNTVMYMFIAYIYISRKYNMSYTD